MQEEAIFLLAFGYSVLPIRRHSMPEETTANCMSNKNPTVLQV
jgi:hypothetical protein